MKLSIVIACLVAVGAASAADVNIRGAQMPSSPSTDIRVASKDQLNRATALLNKNTLASDNNIFIARSNLVFTQNDRLALRKKVEQILASKQENHDTATLTKNVMRAVSAPDTDTALLSKASGVVATKGDTSMLAQKIADFVDAAAKSEMDRELSMQPQSQTPRGVIVRIGTKDLLRQPTAVVNKNIAVSDNQIAITRSNLAPTQNDRVTLGSGAKVADVIAPAARINIGKPGDLYRTAVMYRTSQDPASDDKDDDDSGDNEDKEKKTKKEGKKEQWGWGGGWGLGWRYPLGWWGAYGAGLYGGGCGLGFPLGGFYYC